MTYFNDNAFYCVGLYFFSYFKICIYMISSLLYNIYLIVYIHTDIIIDIELLPTVSMIRPVESLDRDLPDFIHL